MWRPGGWSPKGLMSRFGRSYIGQPDVLAEQLAADEAVQAADLLLLTVPISWEWITTSGCWMAGATD